MGRPITPLRALRRARTLSQRDMARLAKVVQSTYSKYESGVLTPPFHVQALIAAILGGSVRELFPSGEPESVAS